MSKIRPLIFIFIVLSLCFTGIALHKIQKDYEEFKRFLNSD